MVQEQRVNAAEAAKRSWFVHDRFGLFIHWGLYALPARHEWVKNREKLTDEQFAELIHLRPNFEPCQGFSRDIEGDLARFVVNVNLALLSPFRDALAHNAIHQR